MLKVLTALGISVFISLLVMGGWFMVFGVHSLPELGTELISMSESVEFWLGVGIFSTLFFFMFSLPLTLMLSKT